MSEENVDALRRSNRAFNDGDLDQALELWDPQAVYYEQPGNPLDTADVLRGLDQIRASLASYLAEFPDFHSEIDELVDAGDKVVCVQRWTGTGRSSGLSVDLEEAIVFTFRTARSLRKGLPGSRSASKPSACRRGDVGGERGAGPIHVRGFQPPATGRARLALLTRFRVHLAGWAERGPSSRARRSAAGHRGSVLRV
jgi:ketosteroid isomerase-like protein